MTDLIEWAHLGGAREAPSNTLGAIRKALMANGGCVGLKLDVHPTNDGELVVIRDRALERTTNGRGRIRRHQLSDLKRLNAAWWWVPGQVDDHESTFYPLRAEPLDNDRRIPTLDEVLELRKKIRPDAPITIEIKDWRAARPLVERLQREPPFGAKVPTITVTSAFDPILWIVRWKLLGYETPRIDLAPGTGYTMMFWLLTSLGVPIPFSRYARLQIPVRRIFTLVTPRLLAAAGRVRVIGNARTDGKLRRLAVDVWTIDECALMDALIHSLAVNGIMSDRPSCLRKLVDGGLDACGGLGCRPLPKGLDDPR